MKEGKTINFQQHYVLYYVPTVLVLKVEETVYRLLENGGFLDLKVDNTCTTSVS